MTAGGWSGTVAEADRRLAGMAACAAALAMALALLSAARLRVRRRARRARFLFGPPEPTGARARASRLMRLAKAAHPSWLIPELLLLPLGLVAARMAGSAVPVVAAAAAVVPLRRWRLRRRRASEARGRAGAVIDLCTGLAAELRSGATPEQALHTVTSRTGTALTRSLGAEPAARLAAGRYGADVPAALRLVAELPGGRGAAAVAACWRVTAESGTGLAAGLDQVADALRAERALAEEIAGELAGPRTTIAVLAALPLVGLGLGAGLGARPVPVLLHTPAGLLCLACGALLEVAGVVWTARIIRGAEAPPPPPSGGRRRGGAGAPQVVGGRGAPAACGISRVRAAGTAMGPGSGWESGVRASGPGRGCGPSAGAARRRAGRPVPGARRCVWERRRSLGEAA